MRPDFIQACLVISLCLEHVHTHCFLHAEWHVYTHDVRGACERALNDAPILSGLFNCAAPLPHSTFDVLVRPLQAATPAGLPNSYGLWQLALNWLPPPSSATLPPPKAKLPSIRRAVVCTASLTPTKAALVT